MIDGRLKEKVEWIINDMDKGRKKKRKRISKELEKKEERLVTSGKPKWLMDVMMIKVKKKEMKKRTGEQRKKMENRNRS